MSHFAKINQQRVVTQVIVAEEDFIDTLPGTWIQTSYNTHGGVHLQGGTPLRKNYAGIGYTYDYAKDAFIPSKPFESCIGDLSSEYDTPQASAICYQQLAVHLTMDKEWRKSFINSPEATCLTQYKHVGSNIK